MIYDELDLPPGKLRMKTGGSTAGHKGLKSIEAHIGQEFRRMRIGIGHPGAKELVNGYVLHDFAKADSEWVDPLLAAIAENVGAARGRQRLDLHESRPPRNDRRGGEGGEAGTESSVRTCCRVSDRQAPPGKRHWRRLRWLEEALRPRALKAVPPHMLGK